ncbi:hypothetical protein BJ912DRAFT_1066146 [Pholiota molesta]|nr:hypothetical protein BJ912DRAFT_1066146 [Pholiota molesta]
MNACTVRPPLGGTKKSDIRSSGQLSALVSCHRTRTQQHRRTMMIVSASQHGIATSTADVLTPNRSAAHHTGSTVVFHYNAATTGRLTPVSLPPCWNTMTASIPGSASLSVPPAFFRVTGWLIIVTTVPSITAFPATSHHPRSRPQKNHEQKTDVRIHAVVSSDPQLDGNGHRDTGSSEQPSALVSCKRTRRKSVAGLRQQSAGNRNINKERTHTHTPRTAQRFVTAPHRVYRRLARERPHPRDPHRAECRPRASPASCLIITAMPAITDSLPATAHRPAHASSNNAPWALDRRSGVAILDEADQGRATGTRRWGASGGGEGGFVRKDERAYDDGLSAIDAEGAGPGVGTGAVWLDGADNGADPRLSVFIAHSLAGWRIAAAIPAVRIALPSVRGRH